MTRLFAAVFVLVPLLSASGCAVLDVRSDGALRTRKEWVLLPVENLGETPLAGERVEELLLTLLRSEKGIDITQYAPSATGARDADTALDLDERQRFERALALARGQKFIYGIGGSVEEWRYRSASEGEAAVGVTLRVIDLASGRVVFSASGSKAGWGRDTLSGTAQSLLREMVGRLPIQ